MFDVGFSEILVIAAVALIVIGPERLPKVARTLGHLLSRMQRYVNDVKADISREMEIEELRKLQESMQDAARSIEHSVKEEIRTTEAELNSIAAAASHAVSPPVTPESAALARSQEAQSTAPASAGAADARSAETTSPQLELGLDAPPETHKRA